MELDAFTPEQWKAMVHRCYAAVATLESLGYTYRSGDRWDPPLPQRRSSLSPARDDRPITSCQANRDGECVNRNCPQLRDGEPARSGRSCTLIPWDTN